MSRGEGVGREVVSFRGGLEAAVGQVVVCGVAKGTTRLE